MPNKNAVVLGSVLAAISMAGTVQANDKGEPEFAFPEPYPVTQAVEAPFTILHADTFKVSSADSKKTAIVLSTAAEYEQLLSQYTTQAPVKIDFGQNKVLLIESGSKPNSGYAVKVNGIIEHNDRVVAHVSYLTPDDNPACSYMAVVTQPYLFAKIPTDKPLLVREHTEVQPCITGGLGDL